MGWDFDTEPEFEERLEWIRQFRAERIEPLDLLYPGHAFQPLDDELGPVVRKLKQQVRDQGLWAPHLGPELGGRGFGQLKLALINEILGASSWAPVIFGTAAPDTGNAEIIARYGTQEAARAVTAEEAEKVGMVNRVVPLDQLDAVTMELAGQIARMHSFGLRQAKRAVNRTLDVQGFYAAVQSVFDIHETGLGNALSVGGYPILTQLDAMKDRIKSQ